MTVDHGSPEPAYQQLSAILRSRIAQGEWRSRPHPITDGLDLSLVPSGSRGGRFYRYEAKGDVAVDGNFRIDAGARPRVVIEGPDGAPDTVRRVLEHGAPGL